MKFVMGLFVVALTLGSVQAQAGSNEVIFTCDLPDGNHVLVERNADTDVWIYSYGTDLNIPKVTVMKRGNNLGTSVQMSHEEGTLNRELYVTDGDYFYDVGYTDQRGVKKGYLQIMKGGAEESYQTCNRDTMRSKFDDYEMFENLTVVD